MTIEVITSICGGKDTLREHKNKGNAKFIAFTDTQKENKKWEIRPAYDKFADPRRNSRIHKILIHKYSTADVSIWIDGNIKLLVTPEEMVAKYLDGYDMAMFAHPNRNCIYKEALKCCELKLDDIELIIEQAKHYEDSEYGKEKGLCEGGIIIRRNNEKTKALNERWWADYCRFSRRDQISLMPAIDYSMVNINIIPEGFRLSPDSRWIRDGVAEIVSHVHNEGNWNQNE